MKIKRLPSRFKKQQDEFTLIERKRNIALYERRASSGAVSYEVIRITKTNPHPLSDNEEGYEKIEHYPSDNEFGSLGWSFNADNPFQRREAFKKYKELGG